MHASANHGHDDSTLTSRQRYNYLKTMNNLNSMDKSNQPGLDDLISLQQAAKLSGLSQGHLSLLIRNSELWGTKLGGRNWFTSEQAVREYLARDLKPGPKPKSTS